MRIVTVTRNQILSFVAAVMFAIGLAAVLPGVASASQFWDVPDTHWAQKGGFIDRGVDAGIVKGNPDGSFAPDAKVTRGQIAIMMMRAAGADESAYPEDNHTGWIDAKDGAYYVPALNWAWQEGILSKANAAVRPNDSITRQELCVMIRNYAIEQLGKDTSYDANRLYYYSDKNKVASWAKDAVSYAAEWGIIGGASTLNPTGSATRSEALKMLLVFFDGGVKQPAVVLPKPTTPTVTPQPPAQTETVYITPSGSKYHRASCASTKNSKLTAITRTQALSRGYTACKVCKPQ